MYAERTQTSSLPAVCDEKAYIYIIIGRLVTEARRLKTEYLKKADVFGLFFVLLFPFMLIIHKGNILKSYKSYNNILRKNTENDAFFRLLKKCKIILM